MKTIHRLTILFFSIVIFSCSPGNREGDKVTKSDDSMTVAEKRVAEYSEFTLTSDLAILTDNQKEMIPILIEVAEIMDGLFRG